MNQKPNQEQQQGQPGSKQSPQQGSKSQQAPDRDQPGGQTQRQGNPNAGQQERGRTGNQNTLGNREKLPELDSESDR